MMDLIKPKLVHKDIPLFMSLLSNLFPEIKEVKEDANELKTVLEEVLIEDNLEVVPEFVSKIIQIFDCKVARHGNMIVGRTGSGKSTAWRTLQKAMERMHIRHPHEEKYQKVHVNIINPLALSTDEIYGCINELTQEWQDGNN